ncbi:ImmA/IrrE family metallo-endopeptidase [Helicobacter ibis]|uniref:ImmA/IrrE family metallo-endopeptidase n=1 Tax=Helicobacter ibis TaxID=2962633 RepID=A0ABT4VEI5_9HELI|nr:ImmA/IrrE family metallo-endopeptidase [Helicobacter ibis]MDA3969104.1 ImmA/IrrE family metallo-endopeptidase [Helicobacter ibis]
MAFISNKGNKNLDTYNKKTIDEIYHHAENLGIETQPFDIFAYISNIPEIDYWEDYFDDDISGKIEYRTSGIYQIVVNKYHSVSRKRFTLAHEFAHFVLHKDFLKQGNKLEDIILFRSSNDTGNKKELEANQFAADLLMPKIIFDTEIKKGNNKINSLADFFKVSSAAIKYRAFKLGYLKEY